MKCYNLLIVALGSLLAANAVPIPDHDLVPRGRGWNTIKQAVTGNLGKVAWTKSGPMKHPVVQTGGGHQPDDVEFAQASHNLPKNKYPHQQPSNDIVPSAKLQHPSDKRTSFINTGPPDTKKASQLSPDKLGRKASLWDVVKLKFQQKKNTP